MRVERLFNPSFMKEKTVKVRISSSERVEDEVGVEDEGIEKHIP